MDSQEEKLAKKGSTAREEKPLPTRPLPSPEQFSQGQVVSFGERVTYTFAHGREIGSIHFDRMRGEIFYKGHNIRHLPMEEWQLQMLEKMRTVLSTNPQTKRFAEPYDRILNKIILEKSRGNPSP